MKLSLGLAIFTATLSLSLTGTQCLTVGESLNAQRTLSAIEKIGADNTHFRVERRATTGQSTAQHFENELVAIGAKLRDAPKNTGAKAWTATTYVLPKTIKEIFNFVVRQRTYGETIDNKLIEDSEADLKSKFETKVPLPPALSASEGAAVLKVDVTAENGMLGKITSMTQNEGVQFLLKQISREKKIPEESPDIEKYRDLMIDFYNRLKVTSEAYKTFFGKQLSNDNDPLESMRYAVIYNRTAYKKMFKEINPVDGSVTDFEVQFTFDRDVKTSFSPEIDLNVSPRVYLKQALTGTGIKFHEHNELFRQRVAVVELKTPIAIEKRFIEARLAASYGVMDKLERFKTQFPDFYEVRMRYEELTRESIALRAEPDLGKALMIQKLLKSGLD